MHGRRTLGQRVEFSPCHRVTLGKSLILSGLQSPVCKVEGLQPSVPRSPCFGRALGVSCSSALTPTPRPGQRSVSFCLPHTSDSARSRAAAWQARREVPAGGPAVMPSGAGPAGAGSLARPGQAPAGSGALTEVPQEAVVGVTFSAEATAPSRAPDSRHLAVGVRGG